jgi:2-amino-4-hydroxy-6-hydroxymethyldihydropteridine diphosphokinase
MEVHKNRIETFLSLGSNLGDREGNLEEAIGLLSGELGPPFARSRIYESPSWGYKSAFSFLNVCVGYQVSQKPGPLLDLSLEIERTLGRRRSEGKTGPYSDRLIDIDLLFYGSQVLDTPSLVIPHPRLHERRFVLEPLAEIAPNLMHPVLGQAINELLLSCTDPSEVRSF